MRVKTFGSEPVSFPNLHMGNRIFWANDGRIVLNPGPPDRGFVLGLSPMLQGPLPLTARNDLHNPSQDLLETKLSSTDYPLKNKRIFTK